MGMQDLANIERGFNLNPVRHHAEDGTSVEAWVEEMQASNDPCVLYYKPQGSSDDRNSAEDDFNLVIMTKAQEEVLKRFGNDVICIDSTHGTNAYNFMLTTILVLDEFRQGFPCAFFVSNRTDSNAISTFLEIVKEKVGPINCNIFMSDMDNALYNAWVKVMRTPQKRLFCAWHVDSAWQKNIQKKIHNKLDQAETYKLMKSILCETNEEAFTEMFHAVLNQLDLKEETKEFSQYLRDNYSHNVQCWAYCFRKYSGLNTNMHIERMHRTIKHIYLRKKSGRLDIAICSIMKFVKSKVFDRVCALTKGKVSSKIHAIRLNHKKSLSISVDDIVEVDGAWLVNFNSTSYLVERVCESERCDCKLVCDLCHSCIHKFNCACSEASIQWNMCQHIHAVCSYLNKVGRNDIYSASEPTLATQEVDLLVSHVSSEPSHLSKTAKQEVLLQKFTHLLTSVDSQEEFKIVEKYLNTMQATLHAVKASTSVLSEHSVRPSPMVPQRRLYSTKKKAPKKVNRLPKPTQQETNDLTLGLALSLL